MQHWLKQVTACHILVVWRQEWVGATQWVEEDPVEVQVVAAVGVAADFPAAILS